MLKILNILVTTTVLGWFVAGSTTASSSFASLVGTRVVAPNAAVDQRLANAALDPSQDAPTMDRLRATTPQAEIAPEFRLSKADFDRIFADVMGPQRRDNTPANREKLRAAGWRHFVAAQ